MLCFLNIPAGLFPFQVVKRNKPRMTDSETIKCVIVGYLVKRYLLLL